MTWVARRSWGLASVAFLLFAAYGSLVPFHLQARTAGEALQAFLGVVGHPLHVRLSRTDLVANVLLFVPIGFCLAGAFRLDRHAWWAGPVATLATVAVSLPWSVFLEFLQVFTIDRTPSVGDIAAQTFGCLIGVVTWEAFGESLTRWIEAALAVRTRVERVERVLAIYAGAWLLVNLAPFDVTLDVGSLVAKVRGGGIQLLPFPLATPRTPTAAWIWDATISMAAAVPLGVLAVLGWTEPGTRRGWSHAARLVIGGLLLVEIAQVFIASHAADANDLAFGTLGAGVGIWLATTWSPRQPAAGAPTDRARTWAVAGLVGWSVVLALYHWMPFDFRLDGSMVRGRLATLSWVPFSGYRAGNDLGALSQVLVKACLAAPLGLLGGLVVPTQRPVLASTGWLVAAGGWLAIIEMGQLLLPSRVADPTDVLVGLGGVGVGLAIGAWIRHGR